MSQITGNCLHLASLLFYLEEHLDRIVVESFQEKKDDPEPESEEGKILHQVIRHVEKKVNSKKRKSLRSSTLQIMWWLSEVLGRSSFFIPEVEFKKEQGELHFLFLP